MMEDFAPYNGLFGHMKVQRIGYLCSQNINFSYETD